MATIEYSVEWINDKDTKLGEISKVAFHEVMELLLAELTGFLIHKDRYISYSQITTETHNIIRTLENTIHKDFLEPKLNNKKGK